MCERKGVITLRKLLRFNTCFKKKEQSGGKNGATLVYLQHLYERRLFTKARPISLDISQHVHFHHASTIKAKV